MIAVGAAVVKRNGRYLLARRPQGKRHGGLWEFPGGKVQPGESTEVAIRRELKEELGMEVTEVGELLASIHDEGSDFEVHFHPVRAEGDPQLFEHDEVGWFDSDQLPDLPLAPTDRDFATRSLSAL